MFLTSTSLSCAYPLWPSTCVLMQSSHKKKKGAKKDHIPYRDSALTWILKENLGLFRTRLSHKSMGNLNNLTPLYSYASIRPHSDYQLNKLLFSDSFQNLSAFVITSYTLSHYQCSIGHAYIHTYIVYVYLYPFRAQVCVPCSTTVCRQYVYVRTHVVHNYKSSYKQYT